MRRLALFALAPLAALIALPVSVSAHPRLTAATPLANSTVSRPTKLTLSFSEVLVAPLSGIELTMTSMPGMANHAPMPIRGGTTKVEGKSMTIQFPRALPAGTYLLKWHAVAADQHRVENSYTFTVN